MRRLNGRGGAALAAAALAAGALGVAGCGSDNQGPAQEAGKAIDQAAGKVKSEADKVDVNVTTDDSGGGKDKHGGKSGGGGNTGKSGKKKK
jgi:hypothetical protein